MVLDGIVIIVLLSMIIKYLVIHSANGVDSNAKRTED